MKIAKKNEGFSFEFVKKNIKIYYNFDHNHKKRKDCLVTWAELLIFSLEL